MPCAFSHGIHARTVHLMRSVRSLILMLTPWIPFLTVMTESDSITSDDIIDTK